MIKNIVFDFGGVLIDWNPRYVFRSYFNDDKEMEYFLANICTTEWNAEHDRGRLFADGVKMLQKEHPEYSEAIQLYQNGWQKMLKGPVAEGVCLLEELKAKAYPLYGLTNWSAETIHVAYEMFPFLGLLDGVVVSGEEKILKPDARLYRILLERYNLKASETVFIDDNLANVQGAEAVGITGLLYDNIANVRAKLKTLLG